MNALDQNFNLTVLVLIPAIVVTVLAVRKMPALPGLFSGVFVGAICAMLFQGAGLHDVFDVLLNGYTADTGTSGSTPCFRRAGSCP